MSGQFTFGSWLPKSRLCLEFISPVPATAQFLRAVVINGIPGLVNWGACELVTGCSYRKPPQDGSTFPYPPLIPLGQAVLGQVGFLACEIDWNLPEQTGKGLSLTTFTPLKLDWRKHKLESRLPGEISITSDMQMTPPLGRKWRGTKKPLDENERGEWKSWLKAQHSEN